MRWQHCIDHADTKQKPANVARLSSRRSSAADRQSVKRDYNKMRPLTCAKCRECQLCPYYGPVHGIGNSMFWVNVSIITCDGLVAYVSSDYITITALCKDTIRIMQLFIIIVYKQKVLKISVLVVSLCLNGKRAFFMW